MVNPSAMNSDSVIILFNQIDAGFQPYTSLSFSNKFDNPLFPKKVNLEIQEVKGNFYGVEIVNVYGYKFDSTGLVSLYILVKKDRHLIDNMIKHHGNYVTASVDVSPQDGDPNVYIWDYKNFTINLETHFNAFDEDEQGEDFYEITYTKAHPLEYYDLPDLQGSSH